MPVCAVDKQPCKLCQSGRRCGHYLHSAIFFLVGDHIVKRITTEASEENDLYHVDLTKLYAN